MDHVLAALRAIAEESRLRMLALAARAELTVSDFVDILGQSQPRVSRHLKLLAEAGLLERYREGSFAYFRPVRTGAAGRLVEAALADLPVDRMPLEGDLARLAEIRRRRDKRAAYFAQNAVRWHELRTLHTDDRDIESRLEGLLPEGVRSLLDIGTGTGRVLEVLAPKVERAVGIDQSREMLALARANLAKAGVDNVDLRMADMYALPFEAGKFDAVTVHQVLHYADDPAAVLREAGRVLSHGGVALVVDFAPHDLTELRREHAHLHLGFADRQVMGWLQSAGFEPQEPIHLPGDRLDIVIWRGIAKAGTARPFASALRAPLAADAARVV